MFSGEVFVDYHVGMHFMSSKANGEWVIGSKFSLPPTSETVVKLGGWIFCVACCVRELLAVESWEPGVMALWMSLLIIH